MKPCDVCVEGADVLPRNADIPPGISSNCFSSIPLQAKDQSSGSHFSLLILKGRLHLVYSINGVTGVHEIINGPITVTDNIWHRITVGLDRVKGRFLLIVDDSSPEVKINRCVKSTNSMSRISNRTLRYLIPYCWHNCARRATGFCT